MRKIPIDSRLTVSSTAGLQVVAVPAMVPHEFSTNLNGLNIAEFMGVFIVNTGEAYASLKTQDGQFNLLQQAQGKDGTWRTIETWDPATCGNSHFPLKVFPHKQMNTIGRRYKGDFKTKMRFKLSTGEKDVYSNTFEGSFDSKLLASAPAHTE